MPSVQVLNLRVTWIRGFLWNPKEEGKPGMRNPGRREVESLPAVCPSEGCSWKGTLKDYEVGASTEESSRHLGGCTELRARGWGARCLCMLLGWPGGREQQCVRGPGAARAPRRREVSFLAAEVVVSPR